MFGLSTWELLIIVAVALIFVGPDQLPKVARTIGKGMRQVRGAMGKVDDEMRRAVREVAAEIDDEGRPVGPEPDLAGKPAPGAQRTMKEGEPLPLPLPEDPHHTSPEPMNPPATTPSLPGAAERDWSQVGRSGVPNSVARQDGPPRPAESGPEAVPPGAAAEDAPEATGTTPPAASAASPGATPPTPQGTPPA